jgi:hypothetical protein
MNYAEGTVQEPSSPYLVPPDISQTPIDITHEESNGPEGVISDLDLSQHTKKNWPSSKNVSQ